MHCFDFGFDPFLIYGFISDPKTMLIFRTYWPVVTILIGLWVYYRKQRTLKTNLKDLLGWELYCNAMHVYTCFPKKPDASKELNEKCDDILDSAITLAKSSKLFSSVVYDKNISSLDILKSYEKKIIFTAYNLLSHISIIGDEISILLKIEKRSSSEKERLKKNNLIMFELTRDSIPQINKALNVFQFDEDDMNLLLDWQGAAIARMRNKESGISIKTG